MKKSLSRILSVALVLAMLVSVMPFALAANGAGTVSINVTEGKRTVQSGETLHLTASYTPASEEESNPALWSWKGEGVQESTTSETTFKAPEVDEEKQIEIRATAVWISSDSTDEENHFDTQFGTIKITVTPATSTDSKIIISGKKTLVVGESVKFTAEFDPADENRDVVWSSSNPEYVYVDKDKGSVTALKKGSATITATAKDDDTVSAKLDVTVEEDEVSVKCDDVYIGYGETDYLQPKLVSKYEQDYNVVSVDYKQLNGSEYVTVTPSTTKDDICVVKGVKAGGSSKVRVTITYKDNFDQKQEISTDVTVNVYDSVPIELTIKDGTKEFSFSDSTVVTNAKVDGNAVNGKRSLENLVNYALIQYGMDVNLGSRYDIELRYDISSKVGTVVKPKNISSLDSFPLDCLGDVSFTVKGTGSFALGFTIKDVDENVVLVGSATIYVTDGGDIVYETDYNTDITFDEDDFEDFWNNVYTSSTNTLKYVQFGTPNPSRGTLYTTASSTTRKTVTKTMTFGSSRSYSDYDLDDVTYVPSTSYTVAYTVEIPFTAYGGAGTSDATELSGTVVIELNGDSTSITSRGVIFGYGTKSIVDQMITDYAEANKNVKAELAYVTFVLPDVEDGRLYYDYDGILDSTRVSSKDEFFVDASSKQLDLEKVAFIPAAGTTGKVTIKYMGYDKNGKNPYEGKIVLNVTAKTKSDKFTDVTTTSYSWAADSIDFLYYEEVVNGTSSTKFGPAASITRGDFMIMLYRAFLEEDYGDYNVTSNFADVPKGTSAYEKETYQAVGVAKYLGIAKGDGTNFNPKSSITREEAMTLIYRTLDEVDLDLEYTSTKTTASFSDYSKVSTYAQTSITYLIKHGIVIGSNGLINPKSNITRAEMAVILHRVLTY